MESPKNQNKNFMTGDRYGDQAWNKQNELSSGMSITPTAPDELTNKNLNPAGGQN